MITAIILTYNEEKNIIDCIESVNWVDEIIVLDDFSQDRTLDVIKTLNYGRKLKVFRKKLENNFSEQRNYALSRAKTDWILFLDADERVTKQLREEINQVLIREKTSNINQGYFIPRYDVMWGKILRHGDAGNTKLLRLGKRSAGSWVGQVHEQWLIDGKISSLKNHIIHFPHPTISEFLKEINIYTAIRAKELFKNGESASVWDIILYPKAKFIVNYIFKLGFLDGIPGLISAILMSFHSFLVRSKLWLLWQKK